MRPPSKVKPSTPPPVILWRKDLAARYGCDVHSIDRFHREKIIPPARYLPKLLRPFWYQHEIVSNEQRGKHARRLQRHLDRVAAVPAKPIQQFTLPI